MNNIGLIITEGCKACEIQENIIRKAIDVYKDKYNINLIITGKSDYSKHLCNEYKITDFPATMLFVNGNYKTHIVGTCTKEHLMHLFDEHFIENTD